MPATILLTLLLLGGDPTATAPVDEPLAVPAEADAIETTRQREVAVLAPAKARLLAITSDGAGGPVAAALHEEPLLRWSNPTAGSVYGEVFVWQTQGRPVALASIFRWYHPYKEATLEIVSLSTSPVSAREDDELVWESAEPGLAFATLPKAVEPARAPVGRLRQMRGISRRFAAELMDERGGEQVARSLRLLNQPIFRYQSAAHEVIDGALFALAEVTDPEAILLVEAFETDESRQWRYALARMNNHELRVSLDGQVVQTWPHLHDPWKNRKATYTLYSFNAPSSAKDAP